MANLPTRLLRLLVSRGHALSPAEITDANRGVKDADRLAAALELLRRSGCAATTSQGWLATEAGRSYVRTAVHLSFARGRT